MLDIILIQHIDTGINLLEYEQDHTSFDKNHSDIFSGFLSAIQNISSELNIGTVVLISTEGSRGHNCIIIQRYPINIILLVDKADHIDVWRETGQEIANRFIEKYGKKIDSSYVSQYNDF
ncbi:MAG: hypothetical protein GF317_23800, partial [Candidatus Lokiarchaeota archaeon]|nr:hypothetical protein [Candidatus Lokiarchaeota archaeon]MBD3202394.1 hypothetical protein [Candidatus Lokiarchaeota archaeon]